jgi:hypothetical protein
VAERIATPLKRAGVETPILEEVPHAAEVISTFYYEATQYSQGQVLERLRLPAFAHGKAYGKVAGMWYRVTFPRPIADASVVCVGMARRGEVPRPKVREAVIKSIERLKAIDVPRIDINIPDWELHIPTADDFVNLVKNFFGDWMAFNWMRDAIAWAVGNWEYAIWNLFFRPRLFEELNNKVLAPLRTSLNNVRAGINSTIDRINESLREAVDRTNAALDELRLKTRDAINERMPEILTELYEAWGVPSNMAITPLHVRNITSTGFEFQSYGETTVVWMAMGTRA